jgi:hypothetical protein
LPLANTSEHYLSVVEPVPACPETGCVKIRFKVLRIGYFKNFSDTCPNIFDINLVFTQHPKSGVHRETYTLWKAMHLPISSFSPENLYIRWISRAYNVMAHNKDTAPLEFLQRFLEFDKDMLSLGITFCK